jgi:hypothetical protein
VKLLLCDLGVYVMLVGPLINSLFNHITVVVIRDQLIIGFCLINFISNSTDH